MKKLVCVIIVISVALIAVSGVLVKTKSDQAAMQQAVDETVKECYMRILDTIKSTAKNGLSGEEKDLLTARDIGYGYVLRTMQFSTSFSGNQDFHAICILLDESTGTDAIYTLSYSDALYDSLLQLYEDNFQNAEAMEKARTLLEESVVK